LSGFDPASAPSVVAALDADFHMAATTFLNEVIYGDCDF
jgi:hypothetical protein